MSTTDQRLIRSLQASEAPEGLLILGDFLEERGEDRQARTTRLQAAFWSALSHTIRANQHLLTTPQDRLRRLPPQHREATTQVTTTRQEVGQGLHVVVTFCPARIDVHLTLVSAEVRESALWLHLNRRKYEREGELYLKQRARDLAHLAVNWEQRGRLIGETLLHPQ